MKRGLVIGRFMPLHTGHIALIRFAAGQCDELIVSMTFKPHDEIPGPLRFEWIMEEFQDEDKIKPEISLDDFDNESLPLEERMPLWIAFLRRFSPISVVYSSEKYGPMLAEGLGAEHVAFDPERNAYPVSGLMIRGKPMKYWDFISGPAKPYFVRKVCFYGPESTGKSVLAAELAKRHQTEFVPEVSREFIDSNVFTAEDIVRIGYAQTDRVLTKTRSANRFLFCDTDLITTQVYCRHYLKEVPPVLFELEKKVKYDRYFLFDIDVPWVADGLRDLSDRREVMFEVFRNELEVRNIPFVLVKGTFEERARIVEAELSKFL